MRATTPEDRSASLPAYTIETGQDPRVLIVAFTGFGGGLSMPSYEFLGLSQLLDHSRILLRDDSQTCYLKGIPGLAPSLESLLDRLRADIARLSPQTLVVLGTSGGAHAAMLFGHLLRAELVHAFAPFTNLDFRLDHDPQLRTPVVQETRDRLATVPESAWRYFDLQQVLAEGNGTTRFHVHVCAKSRRDLERALRLRGTPQVHIHTFPCDNHAVAVFLARGRILATLLRPGLQQQDLPAVLHWRGEA